jgi:pantetheine-phosphate adenylyltransferase
VTNTQRKEIAIYPGSFDPITNGHIDIIKRAARIFDKVIIAVLDNPEKKALFSVQERLELIKASTNGITNLEYDYFSGLLVEFAETKGVKAIIRGLRAVSDFDYEFQMALTNRQMDEELETIFLMTDAKYSYLSSSLVRQIAKFHGKINQLVPAQVFQALENKFKGADK